MLDPRGMGSLRSTGTILSVATCCHLVLGGFADAAADTGRAVGQYGPEGQALLACQPGITPVMAGPSDLPDEGPRYDRNYRGPESHLFDEIFVAFRCQNFQKAKTAWTKLTQEFAKSPLLPAANAFLAELQVTHKSSQPGRPTDYGQMAAIDAYRAIARDFPGNPNAIRAQWRIGDLYALMESWPEAQATYERLLAAQKTGYDAERAMLGLAATYIGWGRTKEAEYTLQLLRRRAMHESMLRAATLTLADFYSVRKQYRDAQILYEAAYRRWTNFVKERPASLLKFAEAQLMLGQDGAARQLWTTYVNVYTHAPERATILIRLGDSHRAVGERGQAAMFYNMTLVQHADTEGADRARMRLAELGQEMASREDPETLRAYVENTSKKNELPILKEAEQRKVFGEVAQKYKDRSLGSEALYHLGQHHELFQEWPNAITTYKQVLEREGKIAEDVWPETAANRLFQIIAIPLAQAVKSQDDITTITLYHQFGPFKDRLFFVSPYGVAVADAHRRLGLADESVKLYQAILDRKDLKSIHEDALFGLGQSYLEQDDFPAARQALGRYGLRFPYGRWTAEALHARALAYAGEQDQEQTIASCRQWLERYKNHPARREVLLLLAGALERSGRTAEAIRTYAAADQAGTGANPTAMLRLGDLLARTHHPDEAVGRYGQALAAGAEGESAVWARLEMAFILRDRKRYADARVVLKELEDQTIDPLIARMARVLRADMPLSPKDEGG